VVTGAVAAIMLLIGQGSGSALTGLRNLTILVAAPFTVVMLLMCVSLMRDLRGDPLIVRGEIGDEAVDMAVIEGHRLYDGDFEIRIGPVEAERHRSL
jgi:choline-glycine betaine transporter